MSSQYKDPRPKEYFDKYHRRVRTRKPDLVYPIVRGITTFICAVFFRARSIGRKNVAASGPVIIAPNHFSLMDHFFVGMFLRQQVHFMAKSQLFRWPLGWIFKHGGTFPVRRGMRDEEAFTTAETILGRDGLVVMYCEGGRSVTGELSEQAKPGIGRLALESGAPVVPTAIFGSENVRKLGRFRFPPQVTIHYGKPLHYAVERDASRERHQEVADEIFTAIKTLFNDLKERGPRAVRRSLAT